MLLADIVLNKRGSRLLIIACHHFFVGSVLPGLYSLGLAQGGTLRLFSITKSGDRRLWRIVDELLFREQYLHASGKFTNQRSAVLDADWSDARDEIAGGVFTNCNRAPP